MTLLAAAALDLARCGLVLVTSRHPGPAAGLVAAGLASHPMTRRASACTVRDIAAGPAITHAEGHIVFTT